MAGVVDPLEAEDDTAPAREPSFAGVVDDIEEDYEGDNTAYASLSGLGPKKKTADAAPRKKKKLALALNDAEFAKAVEVMELNAGQLMTNPQKSSRITEFKTFEQFDMGEDEDEDLADSLWADVPPEEPLDMPVTPDAEPVEAEPVEQVELDDEPVAQAQDHTQADHADAAYAAEDETAEEEDDWEDETAFWANQAAGELSQSDPEDEQPYGEEPLEEASEGEGPEGEGPGAVEAIEAGDEADSSESMPSLILGGGGKGKKLDALGNELHAEISDDDFVDPDAEQEYSWQHSAQDQQPAAEEPSGEPVADVPDAPEEAAPVADDEEFDVFAAVAEGFDEVEQGALPDAPEPAAKPPATEEPVQLDDWNDSEPQAEPEPVAWEEPPLEAPPEADEVSWQEPQPAESDEMEPEPVAQESQAELEVEPEDEYEPAIWDDPEPEPEYLDEPSFEEQVSPKRFFESSPHLAMQEMPEPEPAPITEQVRLPVAPAPESAGHSIRAKIARDVVPEVTFWDRVGTLLAWIARSVGKLWKRYFG